MNCLLVFAFAFSSSTLRPYKKKFFIFSFIAGIIAVVKGQLGVYLSQSLDYVHLFLISKGLLIKLLILHTRTTHAAVNRRHPDSQIMCVYVLSSNRGTQ